MQRTFPRFMQIAGRAAAFSACFVLVACSTSSQDPASKLAKPAPIKPATDLSDGDYPGHVYRNMSQLHLRYAAASNVRQNGSFYVYQDGQLDQKITASWQVNIEAQRERRFWKIDVSRLGLGDKQLEPDGQPIFAATAQSLPIGGLVNIEIATPYLEGERPGFLDKKDRRRILTQLTKAIGAELPGRPIAATNYQPPNLAAFGMLNGMLSKLGYPVARADNATIYTLAERIEGQTWDGGVPCVVVVGHGAHEYDIDGKRTRYDVAGHWLINKDNGLLHKTVFVFNEETQDGERQSTYDFILRVWTAPS